LTLPVARRRHSDWPGILVNVRRRRDESVGGKTLHREKVMANQLGDVRALAADERSVIYQPKVEKIDYEGVYDLVGRSFLWLTCRFPRARRWLFRIFFDNLARFFSDLDWWTMMNYGYVNLGDTAPLRLDHADEPERTCIQLYHHVISGVDLTGRDVLEVSCGRGGGASYVARYLRPNSVTGIDISPRAIAFCNRVHHTPGLRYLVGDAESIPANDESFDAVVNVEASFCYGDLGSFFREVHRVLRAGGYFFYADLRMAHEVEDWLAAIRRSSFKIAHMEEINENVVRALQVDYGRRNEAARRLAPAPFRQAMRTFVGAGGTRMPTLLADQRMRYLSFVLRKASGKKYKQSH
jgi:SAM-dependent methyltransferase